MHLRHSCHPVLHKVPHKHARPRSPGRASPSQGRPQRASSQISRRKIKKGADYVLFMELPLGTREEELTSRISICQSTGFTPFLSQWRAPRLGGVRCNPAFLQTVKKKNKLHHSKAISKNNPASKQLLVHYDSLFPRHISQTFLHPGLFQQKPQFPFPTGRPSFPRCRAPSLLAEAGRENPDGGDDPGKTPPSPLSLAPDARGSLGGGKPGA